jgi:excisionase family DNA binding protein
LGVSVAWREIRWEGGDTGVSATGHLLSAGELAERWQVPKSHVYRLTRDGVIAAVRLGRYCRYRLEAIERWEARSEQIGGMSAQAA